MMTDLPPVVTPPPIVRPAEPKGFPAVYNAAVEAVTAGKAVVLVVGGGDAADATHCCPSFPAVADGVYDCTLESGKPVMRKRVPKVVPYQYQTIVPSLGLFRPASGST